MGDFALLCHNMTPIQNAVEIAAACLPCANVAPPPPPNETSRWNVSPKWQTGSLVALVGSLSLVKFADINVFIFAGI